MLTSHHVGDVKALTNRLIIINHGKLAYDGAIDRIVRDLASYRLLRATFAKAINALTLAAWGTW